MKRKTIFITSIPDYSAELDTLTSDEAFEEFKKTKDYDSTKEYVIIFNGDLCNWSIFLLE